MTIRATVTSRDDTPIAVERGGSGPHLVLVHGTSASSARWAAIRPLLEEHFTVTAMDRRGRGGSGDTEPYALEREYEDVAAVVDACGTPGLLFGHSYGGLCSLGAMRLTANVAGLVLYEAPVLEGGGIPEPLIARLECALAAGDRETVVETFCREVVGMRDSDFAALRASPAWPARIAAAHTLPRELRAAGGFRMAQVEPGAIGVPTLLLAGGDSPAFFIDAMARLAAAMPGARSAPLPGQQHVAMDTAPKMLADLVVGFRRDAVV